MNQEDDASYKLLFSAPELVRDLIMGFIPDAWLHGLDYDTLESYPAATLPMTSGTVLMMSSGG